MFISISFEDSILTRRIFLSNSKRFLNSFCPKERIVLGEIFNIDRTNMIIRYVSLMWHKNYDPLERKVQTNNTHVSVGREERDGNPLPNISILFFSCSEWRSDFLFIGQKVDIFQLLKDFFGTANFQTVFHWNFDKNQPSFGVSLKRAAFHWVAVFSWNWTFQLHRNIFKGGRDK